MWTRSPMPLDPEETDQAAARLLRTGMTWESRRHLRHWQGESDPNPLGKREADGVAKAEVVPNGS